ncbi:DUF4124 domain-containing protein [Thiofilum flexile]|uniref:DUF4124 domain-containing protein n=1 Tax=Thiofilum flexile TaxID=125627 RepID=UPI000362AC66|nr:DUF4124 domain-containing protein [Thiofilum flexile]
MTKSAYFLLSYMIMCTAMPVQAQLYRWVDAEGKVTYSDKIPPQATNLGHAELNKQGTTVKVAPPAKTAAEINAANEAKLKQQQLAEKAKYKAELERNLTDSYATVDELVAVYENRLSLQKSTLSQLRDTRAKLATELAKQREKLAKIKDKDQIKTLEGFIKTSEADLNTYDKAIEQGLMETLKINEQYEADKKRLEELLADKAAKTGSSGSTSVTPETPAAN